MSMNLLTKNSGPIAVLDTCEDGSMASMVTIVAISGNWGTTVTISFNSLEQIYSEAKKIMDLQNLKN